MKILQRQVIMSGKEEVIFPTWEYGIHNGDGGRFHPVDSHCFEDIQGETLDQVTWRRKEIVYWSEK